MQEKNKWRIALTGVLLGFVLVFASPNLLHPNGISPIPMLAEMVAVCTSVFFVNLRLLLPRWLFLGR